MLLLSRFPRSFAHCATGKSRILACFSRLYHTGCEPISNAGLSGGAFWSGDFVHKPFIHDRLIPRNTVGRFPAFTWADPFCPARCTSAHQPISAQTTRPKALLAHLAPGIPGDSDLRHQFLLAPQLHPRLPAHHRLRSRQLGAVDSGPQRPHASGVSPGIAVPPVRLRAGAPARRPYSTPARGSGCSCTPA